MSQCNYTDEAPMVVCLGDNTVRIHRVNTSSVILVEVKKKQPF